MVGDPNEVLGESEDDFYGRQGRLIQYVHGNADGVTERDTWLNSLDPETRRCVSSDPIEVSGDAASVAFTVAEGCELTLSLVSYTLPGGEFSFETAGEQEMTAATTRTFGPGEHELSVGLPTGTPPLPSAVTTELLADGFTSPVGVEFPTGAGGRAYVVDQYGTISVVDGGTTSTFLDVSDRMVALPDGITEMGLLGLAFHPNFPDDGRVFVRYSAPLREGMPDDYNHTFVLSEFSATVDGADPDSERVLLEIPEPQANHNAGAVAFGPDGLLYVAVGDGGAANDQGLGHVEDWYDAVAGGNGQDVTQNLLGSMLRIDPDGGGEGEAYGVPEDNPLVGTEGLDEHYAWGFRNPWRFSFDRETGDLYVGDVGQGMWEEIDRVERGGNYGWNVYEGSHPFMADSAPETTDDGEPLLPPVVDYPHESDEDEVTGGTVIGGYVYRGSAVPGLEGRYVFGDWQVPGQLFVADPAEGTGWPISTIDLGGVDGRTLSFGEDANGELYVCSTGESGGAVHRISGAL